MEAPKDSTGHRYCYCHTAYLNEETLCLIDTKYGKGWYLK